MILLPSRGRPKKLQRFIKAFKETKAVEPVCVILEAEERSYYAEVLEYAPANWIVRCFKNGRGAGSHINHIFHEFPNLEYYGQTADDVVPETPHWDQILKRACLPDKVAYGDDGMDHSHTCGDYHYPTHPFIGGALVRHWGFIMPPGLVHYGGDAWWHQAGNQVIVTDVKITHHHWLNGKARKDKTYRRALQGRDQKQIYRKFRNQNQNLMIKDQPNVIITSCALGF